LTKPAQHSVQLTVGTRRVFKPFVWLEVGSGKAALSSLAHQRVPREDHMGQAASRWATTF